MSMDITCTPSLRSLGSTEDHAAGDKGSKDLDQGHASMPVEVLDGKAPYDCCGSCKLTRQSSAVVLTDRGDIAHHFV